ncbi:hypothetical protein G7072_06795 [Nocardioides sp. HDW12B]|uniref:hypothetical protein n=1 Tax=Nocardioides sp. HDW12B TaxID=2714939 RepID=UPI00140D80CA|nr:hypothetical protein [Nocardioides sp. HDW12B]QIK66088.1 hypothetical protein G7072_06795 [Nocardioides sp. HDW12B]
MSAGGDRPEDLPEDQADERTDESGGPDAPDGDGDNARSGSDDDFEAAFRLIVDNYGDRPSVAAPEPDEPRPTAPSPEDVTDTPVVSPGLFRLAGEEVPPPPAEHQDHFVPPEPPPVPWPEPKRGLAWLALFGSPVIMLATLLLSIAVPSWVTSMLGFTFIGGFVYLVATMRRGPSDGWDDGARL